MWHVWSGEHQDLSRYLHVCSKSTMCAIHTDTQTQTHTDTQTQTHTCILIKLVSLDCTEQWSYDQLPCCLAFWRCWENSYRQIFDYTSSWLRTYHQIRYSNVFQSVLYVCLIYQVFCWTIMWSCFSLVIHKWVWCMHTTPLLIKVNLCGRKVTKHMILKYVIVHVRELSCVTSGVILWCSRQ